MSKTDSAILLIKEIRYLFHLLAHTSEQLNKTGLTAGQRAILEAILEGGNRTVPDIARDKRVTRQHILNQVTPLKEAGLLKYLENPAHKRSFLVALTKKGKSVIEDTLRNEQQALQSLLKGHRKEEIDEVALFLRKFGQSIDSKKLMQ